MVESQFATLEPPGDDETDVASIAAEATGVAARRSAGRARRCGPAPPPSPCTRTAAPSARSPDELEALVARIADDEVLARGARRVLLVPPDLTRLHSRAGEIAGILFETLTAAGCEVAILPALGTHAAMTAAEAACSSASGSRSTGSSCTAGATGSSASGRSRPPRSRRSRAAGSGDPDRGRRAAPLRLGPGRLDRPGRPARGDRHGQLHQEPRHRPRRLGDHRPQPLPRRGLRPGDDHGPCRQPRPRRRRRRLRPPSGARVQVLWLLTVTEDTPAGVVHRGLFAGRGRSAGSGGAAFRAAARLSAAATSMSSQSRSTGRLLARPAGVPHHLACEQGRLPHADGDRRRRRTHRARTRRHPFRGGPRIDALVRRHGYRGTPATLEAIAADPELAADLGAAAHLIHGSSEGRFRITYCTDPGRGGLTAPRWRTSATPGDRSPTSSTASASTARRRPGHGSTDGEPFLHIANPALGLWTTRAQIR